MQTGYAHVVISLACEQTQSINLPMFALRLKRFCTAIAICLVGAAAYGAANSIDAMRMDDVSAKGVPLESQATPQSPHTTSLTLFFADSNDRSIQNVRLVGYIIQPHANTLNSLGDVGLSDENGRIIIPDVPPGQHVLAVAVHPDHEMAELQFTASIENTPVRWKLKNVSSSIRGKVLDAATLQPIVGAQIKGSSRPDRDGLVVDLRQLFSIPVSSDGSFEIKSVNPAWRTSLRIVAPGYVRMPVEISSKDAHSNQVSPSIYQLVRGLRLTGKIIDPNGILSKASYINLSCRNSTQNVYQSDNVIKIFSWRDRFSITHGDEAVTSETDGVVPSEIPFSIGELPAGPITLRLSLSGPELPRTLFSNSSSGSPVFFYEQLIDLTKDRDDLIINVGPPDTAPVIDVLFKVPEGMRPPSGELLVEHDSKKQIGCIRMASPSARFPIENRRTQVQLPANGWVTLSDSYLVGYRFDPDKSRRYQGVHIQSQRQEMIIDLVPAGTLIATFIPPQKSNVSDNDHANFPVDFELWYRFQPSDSPKPQWIQHYNPYRARRVSPDGTITINALPLDQTYLIFAQRGDCIATSAEVPLTQAHASVNVTFPEGVAIKGRVLDSDGRPVAGLKLHLACSQTRLGPYTTDTDGRFVLPHVNLDLEFPLLLRIPAYSDHQPLDLPIDKATAQPLTIKLKRGHIVSGTVVDGETGKPLAGVMLNAYSRDPRYNSTTDGMPMTMAPEYPSGGPTDEKGVFRFSTLPDGQVAIFIAYPYEMDALASRIGGVNGDALTGRKAERDHIVLQLPDDAGVTIDIRTQPKRRPKENLPQ